MQWRSDRVFDSIETEGPRVRASLHSGSSARHIYPSLVLVQPRKTSPYLTERLLMGRKESNQTNKQHLRDLKQETSLFVSILVLFDQLKFRAQLF